MGSSDTPDLLMESARDLSQLTVSGLPVLSIVNLAGVHLPVVTSNVVVINTGSVVDKVLSISSPDHTVVTHGDVEESVVLLVEDVAPTVTLWKGFDDTSSEESVSFSIDTNQL
jgi:hypothetical protein